jgi:hypothetical protein
VHLFDGLIVDEQTAEKLTQDLRFGTRD